MLDCRYIFLDGHQRLQRNLFCYMFPSGQNRLWCFTLYYHMDLLMINGHFACQDCREDTIDYIPGVKAIEPKDMASYLQETEYKHPFTINLFSRPSTTLEMQIFFYATLCKNLRSRLCQPYKPRCPAMQLDPFFLMAFTKSFVATSLWSESDCHPLPHYVAKRDLVEIAKGLSLSKILFGCSGLILLSSDDADPLPDGFEEEVADRAMIIPWCSQRAVLAHPSGRRVLDTLWMELCARKYMVPLLSLPLHTDQFTNRKLVVDDWKIGFNLSDGRFVTKEEVSNNVKRLMSGKSEDGFRNTIKEMKKTLENALSCNGSSEKNMARFVKDLKTKISEKMKPVDRSACTGG
ncbi:LOW QUALITY PROTEIN: UDP-glycosyltransferase 86A2-like [Populus alba x Populus x berolinensis]|nr:LOW QUALITY PROTEIN: UDP-glycosyltransferase 86A2-like [Populus alba x Populus x berolinensis]